LAPIFWFSQNVIETRPNTEETAAMFQWDFSKTKETLTGAKEDFPNTIHSMSWTIETAPKTIRYLAPIR
jgi:hypothetical protein